MRTCLALLLSATLGVGQSRLFDYEAKGFEQFGQRVARAGDVDGDGVDDVIASAPGRAVWVFSGQDGRRLLEIAAADGETDFGATVSALDDVDGDGFADFAIGVPQAGGSGPGLVLVISGKTGQQLRTLTGDRLGDACGAALLAVPDLDRDGVAELAIGLPGHDNLAEDSGLVRIVSGRTARPLLYRPGASRGERLGSSLELAGDWNQDGAPDLAVGVPGGDLVRVISTKDASILATLQGPAGSEFGAALASAELNGAFPPDLWVGAPGFRDATGHRGRLSAWAGGTGKLLFRVDSPVAGSVVRTLSGKAPGEWFGRGLAAAGDLDADGYEDLWVGAPLSGATFVDEGAARLLSGKDGSELFSVTGEAKNDFFGQVVSAAGDVDRDGTGDLLATAMGGGYVKLISGKTGHTLRRIPGDTASFFGGALAGAGDLDADGVPDLLIAAPFAQKASGRVDWISGKTGTLIRRLTGQPGALFGSAVASAGDVDDDGRYDVLIGAPGESGARGAVYLFSGRTGAQLLTVTGKAAGDLFGTAIVILARGPDDGAEILIGAPGNAAGYVERRLASNGTLLATVAGKATGDEFGSALAALPMHGDRVRFVVGAPMSGNASGAGYAQVFEDDTVVLERTGGQPGDSFGQLVAAAGDLAVAAPSAAGRGQVVVYAGLDPSVRLGESLASVGDLNGDQREDLAVGEPGFQRVRLLSGRDGTALGEIARELAGFGAALGTADVNSDGLLDLIVGTRAGTASVYATKDLELEYDVHELSLAQGGRQRFDLAFGATAAGKLYTTLGTLSGIHPGLTVGAHHLAINPDTYTVLTLANPFSPPLIQGRGFLDTGGRATAAFELPPLRDTRLIGVGLHHAVIVFGFTFQVDAISNSAPLLLER